MNLFLILFCSDPIAPSVTLQANTPLLPPQNHNKAMQKRRPPVLDLSYISPSPTENDNRDGSRSHLARKTQGNPIRSTEEF